MEGLIDAADKATEQDVTLIYLDLISLNMSMIHMDTRREIKY